MAHNQLIVKALNMETETDTFFAVLNRQQIENCSTASQNAKVHGDIEIDPQNTDPEETNENDKLDDENTGVVNNIR